MCGEPAILRPVRARRDLTRHEREAPADFFWHEQLDVDQPGVHQGADDVGCLEDGEAALESVKFCKPHLIILDVMMPRLDGYQTCALIKRSPRFHKTPVVMLSSKDGLFDRARGRMVGSSEYLTKPFTKDSLLSAVKQHSMN